MSTFHIVVIIYSPLRLICHPDNWTLCLIRTISLNTLHRLPMLKCTLNSTPWLIHTKTLNFEGDKITIVDCTCTKRKVTLGKLSQECSVMIGWFLFTLANLHHFLYVTSHIQQQPSSCVNLALEESEEWILDILHGSTHLRHRLNTHWFE